MGFIGRGLSRGGGGTPAGFRAPKILKDALGESELLVGTTSDSILPLTSSSSLASQLTGHSNANKRQREACLVAQDVPPREQKGRRIDQAGVGSQNIATSIHFPVTTPDIDHEDNMYNLVDEAPPDAYAMMLEIEEDRRQSTDLGFTQRSPSSDKLPPSSDQAGGEAPISFSQQMIPLTPPQHATSLMHNSPPVTFYGLPLAAKKLFEARGVKKLYEWQHEVLSRDDVAEGKNFVYSLPTSGGKTLVAEVLLMRAVLNAQPDGSSRSAMLVLPFVSLADEKTVSMQSFATQFGFPVEGYYGTNGRFPLPHVAAIYVCTIEKANSLYNHLCEEGRHLELGCVVVDELHMVGEPRRGATLELLLTKILAVSKGATQIVGMSATVPNLPVIARWLQASCFICDFRPVPLQQFSVCDGAVLDGGTTQHRVLASCSNDHESLLCLVSEIPDCSTLVFCASRQSTMDTAKQIARGLVRMYQWPVQPHAAEILQELRALGHDEGASPLFETVPYGVAFHHGGLLMEEREFIERCYRMRRITILCCTSTLAAGVNLPARRVVFRTPYIGRDFLTKSRYLQMCGRAGRAGLDTFGESYLILSRRDRAKGHELMQQATEDSSSGLLFANDGQVDEQPLTRALLECVGIGMLTSVGTAIGFAKKLLCFVERAERIVTNNSASDSDSLVAVNEHFTQSFERTIQESLAQLERQRFLTITAPAALPGDDDERTVDSAKSALPTSAAATTTYPLDFVITPTPFGTSAVRSCFGIEEAVMIRDELAILQETGVILSDDLHLCYFLTPVREVVDCDWQCYQRILNRLSDTRQRITEAVGVNEYYISQCAMGIPGIMSPSMANSPFFSSTDTLLSDPAKRQLFTVRRFYVAMILSDLLAETPFHVVEAKYKVNRGQLQSLLKSASMFSSSMTSFCNAMQWFSLEALLASFVKRLGFGVRPDIVPLMEIKGVQASRARALWNAGYRDAASIAAANAQELVDRVKKNNPPDSKAAKFFLLKSAVSVIREAVKHIQSLIKEKKGELLELTARSTATQPSLRR